MYDLTVFDKGILHWPPEQQPICDSINQSRHAIQYADQSELQAELN